jgi:hypothetical protein
MSRAELAQEAIAAWLASTAPDEQRTQALQALLDALINATIAAARQGDGTEREGLAAAIVPLRAALTLWEAARRLPPYAALLGCLQALLRGNEPQTEALDEELRATFAVIRRRATTDSDELEQREIRLNYERAERALLVALEQGSLPQREALARQMDTAAREATAGQRRGAPWFVLGEFLAAATLLLRGQPLNHRLLSVETRQRIERIVAMVQPAQAGGADDAALPASVLYALMNNNAAELDAALAALPEHERARVVTTLERQVHEQMVRLSDDERAELTRSTQAAQIALAAERARELATQALASSSREERFALAFEIQDAADNAARDEPEGSPWHELATFLYAVAALLRGQATPAVPDAYRELWQALRELERKPQEL